MGVDASHMAARMAWMAEAKPELWAATAQVLLPKDWVIGQLTGAYVSDPVSQIGAVGQNGTFIGDLFERIDGGARACRTCAIPPPSRANARLPGAERPVPVATGLMDAWASMFGVGVKAEGRRDVPVGHQRDPRRHLGPTCTPPRARWSSRRIWA
jgi:xylulokinase